MLDILNDLQDDISFVFDLFIQIIWSPFYSLTIFNNKLYYRKHFASEQQTHSIQGRNTHFDNQNESNIFDATGFNQS